jgi:PAS domain S-box-containing protein
VIITDTDGKIEYVNPKVCETTGYTRDELIGQNPRIFKSGEVPVHEYKIIWDDIISGKKWHGEFHNKKKNGELFWEVASISPVFDANGSITHYVAIKEDITRQKEMIVELKEAKEKAEAGDRLKMAFIQNISHEIRTPLSGILGFAEFVLQPEITEDEKILYRDIITTSSDRLLNTITNYMDISLIVSGNMLFKPKKVNLVDVLNSVYDKFNPKCKAKNLEFIKQLPSEDSNFSLFSDPALLTKAISHLLDNAIKFTKTGTITMGFRILNGEYEIFVKDTGSGISHEAQGKVFQIFMQEEVSDAREYEGSGLGLSISKGLVELIGGKIRIESSKGKGTTIIITLRSEDLNANKRESSGNSERKVKEKEVKKAPLILVAEDNDFNSSFYKIILERASFKFLQAKNGAEAVEICRTNPEISLVLMDIKMPFMDGFEATRKIREFRQDLPIISISALATSADKERAMQAGCNEYLTKPVNIGPLLKTISDYVNN